jgi:hypothetical protein
MVDGIKVVAVEKDLLQISGLQEQVKPVLFLELLSHMQLAVLVVLNKV